MDYLIDTEVPAVWQVGDVVLGLYEVRDVITSGGMGVVYRVHHRGWNADLAVKSPRLEYFRSEGQRENFERECETWVNLRLHPNIITCHYVRRLGGIPRIFAEYVDGGSLSEVIRSGRLYLGGASESLERVLDFAIQSAWGLHAAHEEGLVHQDVKPANMMVAPDGVLKVTDFGLARARAAAGESTEVSDGRSILVSSGGRTPAYCSPEQARGGQLSRKTDVWSWGVSAMEMFTGGVTWAAGQLAMEALEAYLASENDGGGNSRVRPEMPPALAELLRSCFQPEPRARPQTMMEIADRLRGIYQELTGHDYPRSATGVAEDRPDALNNRAVSLLDLGKRGDAEALLEKALQLDAIHAAATYNLGLLLWLSGRMTDKAFVQRVANCRAQRDGWMAKYFLGQLHLLRGDAEAAVEALDEAAHLTKDAGPKAALAAAKALISKSAKCVGMLEGHTDGVGVLACSGDGRWALSGGGDQPVRFWDVAAGRCLQTFRKQLFAKGAFLSEDGRWALAESLCKIHLWDFQGGKRVKEFPIYGGVNSLALSGDCRRLACATGCSEPPPSDVISKDTRVVIFDVASGQRVGELAGHDVGVTSVCYSRDDLFLLSGSLDGTLRFWDARTGKCIRKLEGHRGGVKSACLSRDCRRILSGGYDKTLRLWDVATGQELKVYEGHESVVSSVCLSDDGRWAVSGSGDQTVRVWEVGSGRCARTLGGHTKGVTVVRMSGDGLRALSASTDQTVRVWGLGEICGSSAACRLIPWGLCRTDSSHLVVSAEGRFRSLMERCEDSGRRGAFAEAWGLLGEARTVQGYERSPKVLAAAAAFGRHGTREGVRDAWLAHELIGHSGRVNSVALSDDGRRVATGGVDGSVRLWDVETGECVWKFRGRPNSVAMSVGISVDGNMLLLRDRVQLYEASALSPAADGSVSSCLLLLDAIAGDCTRVYDLRALPARVSADCRWMLLSGGEGWQMRDTIRGEVVRAFRPDAEVRNLENLTLSKDMVVAAGCGDKVVVVWELLSGACLQKLPADDFKVYSVCLSSDRGLVLSGGFDKTLKLWELATGECRRVFRGHTEPVSSVALSEDGRWALSGSWDKTVRLWEVATGKCVRTLVGHGAEITSVGLSRDCQWAVSGSADKTARLWRFDWEFEFPKASDWNEGARPHLEGFLNLFGNFQPSWREADINSLMRGLENAGLGWIRPDSVRSKLAEMASAWRGPRAPAVSRRAAPVVASQVEKTKGSGFSLWKLFIVSRCGDSVAFVQTCLGSVIQLLPLNSLTGSSDDELGHFLMKLCWLRLCLDCSLEQHQSYFVRSS